MRLASLRAGGRDGSLLVVASDGLRAADARSVAPSLQAALDDWERSEPGLSALSRAVEAGSVPTFELDFHALAPPCRAPTSGSTARRTSNHIRPRAQGARRRAAADAQDRSARLPGRLAACCSGPPSRSRSPITAWGLDFESEVCVVLGDTPQGTTRGGRGAARAAARCWCNDMHAPQPRSPTSSPRASASSARSRRARSLPSRSRPTSSATRCRDGRVHLPLRATPERRARRRPRRRARDALLVLRADRAHRPGRAASRRGRSSAAGTASNSDPARGVSLPRRAAGAIETIEHGAARTPFLTVGDRVTDRDARRRRAQRSFGTIDQEVAARREALRATGGAARRWRVRIALALEGPRLRERPRAPAPRRRRAVLAEFPRQEPARAGAGARDPERERRAAPHRPVAGDHRVSSTSVAPSRRSCRATSLERARVRAARRAGQLRHPAAAEPALRSTASSDLGGDPKAWAHAASLHRRPRCVRARDRGAFAGPLPAWATEPTLADYLPRAAALQRARRFRGARDRSAPVCGGAGLRVLQRAPPRRVNPTPSYRPRLEQAPFRGKDPAWPRSSPLGNLGLEGLH